jgi:4-amino-4-deoxy-L-arabinose transferase-like glycosyltransferase
MPAMTGALDAVRVAAARATGRCARAIRAFLPPGPAGYVLIGLLVVGIYLRLVAIVSLWPTTNALDDGYQLFAGNPFEDPQHPAGYGLIVAGLGHLTREVAVPVLLQHLSAIASALLLFAATRRVADSAWAGLLPAAVIMLDPDLIYLEQAIMSESWSVLATSVGLYAAVRALDSPSWRWPLLAGVALALGVTIRSAGLLLIPVVVLALLLGRPKPVRNWRRSWRAPVAAAAGAAVILLAFAAANASFGERFGISPSPGRYLYGRVAQFADCSRFDPPPGTEVLCEDTPAEARPGASHYLFGADAPAPRYFGPFGENDEVLGEWSQRAIRAQPLDFAETAWIYLRSYMVPGSRPPETGGDIDPQLDFTYENAFFVPTIEGNLERFYDDFEAHRYEPGLEFLRAWQHVTRFGATALVVTTLLTAIGLVIGTRRSRIGVLLFGVGGLALLVAPVLTGNYLGRYVVPMAGPMMAAAAITIAELSRRWRAQRT